MFKGKTIVLGVSSSVSAYKTLDLIKQLRKDGADVWVLMSKNGTYLVDPKEFEEASGNPVSFEQFVSGVDFRDYLKKDADMSHISLADRADVILICPCTANSIGKIANGIADTLLTSTVMATNAPVIICPAMNVKMWYNPIMQENVTKLENLGYEFVSPEKGILACGYEGMGRLAGFDRVIEKLKIVLGRSSELSGKKIIVTAGATCEEIDFVRVITNKSSGKQGASIAREAAKRGAEVVLIRGKNSVEPSRFGIKDIVISSVDDMFNAIKEHVSDSDIMIHSAAVSDFEVCNKHEDKIKSDSELHLELTPTTKIFDRIKEINKDIFLVGFKAECNLSEEELVNRAYNRLIDAKADLIAANDVSKKDRGFDVDSNEVFIVDKEKNVTHVALSSKDLVASRLLDEICKLL